MRPLVQYDLDDPPTVHSAPPVPIGPQPGTGQPPNKKRKRHHHNPRQPPSRKMLVQHWDDPGSTAVGVTYDDESGGDSSMAVGEEDEHDYDEEAVEGVDDEESRPLTSEEIWDDSALIDAWNSAQAEYEAYHGTSKDWKTEPVKKSPLWYNKPYTPKPGPAVCSKHNPSLYQAQDGDGDLEPDSAPLDFNTYMPTHDPSLAMPSGPANGAGAGAASTAPYFVPPASMATVSRDEAFQNAMNAMYWTGYWTAVYHCQDHTGDTKDDARAEADEEDEIDEDKGEDEQNLAPAQR